MNLYEYQGKALFKKYGVPVPQGYVVFKPEEIMDFYGERVIKAQVLTGGRGKSGGVKFASNVEEARKLAKEILSMEIKGHKVHAILVEEKLKIEKEYYLSILIDRSTRKPLIMASPEGGVEIESVPDEKIYKFVVNPEIGVQPFVGRALAKKMGFTGDLAKQFTNILMNLYKLFREYDAELVEINPLVLTEGKEVKTEMYPPMSGMTLSTKAPGKLIAADSKVVIDTDSLYRHKDLEENAEEKTPLELEATKAGYAFVELDGNVGVIANGAGLTMATLDTLLLYGLKPRNFLDLGGTDSVDITKNAFTYVLKANPDAILVNIFGGVTKCDTVAQGIIAAKEAFNINMPIVVRLSGVHEEEGRKMLEENGIHAFADMRHAIEKLKEIMEGSQ